MNPIPFDSGKRELQKLIDDPDLEDVLVIFTKKSEATISLTSSQTDVAKIVFWLEQAKLSAIEDANNQLE